jgi:hypothetical protein
MSLVLYLLQCWGVCDVGLVARDKFLFLTEYVLCYIRPKISPSLSLVTGRGEGNTKDGRGKGEGLGSFRMRYSLAVFPSLYPASWPSHGCVCDGERSSEELCYICT